jgi:hypothetical protein
MTKKTMKTCIECKRKFEFEECKNCSGLKRGKCRCKKCYYDLFNQSLTACGEIIYEESKPSTFIFR